MKLNAATEWSPIAWPGFAELHPFAPADQAAGYAELIGQLRGLLVELTGYDAVSLQPNAGSPGGVRRPAGYPGPGTGHAATSTATCA